MTNYIPADKEARFQLEKVNPLYRELFDRRAEGHCDECDDLGHNRLCFSCAHNSETDVSVLSISEVSIARIRKAKKFSKRPKILKTFFGNGKCPCCDSSKGWTKTLIAYFSSSDSELKLGQCVASYCPICGKNVEE